MKEYFNGFSTQDLVDMRRNDEKRKEKVEMEKEIERLNNDIKEMLKENGNKEKVIKAQDNIINELEKYLEEIKDRVIMYGIDDDTYKTTNLYRDIKNKIKELQGSDKE